MLPDFASDGGNRVTEGQCGLVVPGGNPGGDPTGLGQVVHPQDDEGVKSEQGGRGSEDSEIGPLALGLDAKMSAGLLERQGDILPTNMT